MPWPIPPLHPWTLDPDEAARLQVSLRERLRLAWDGRIVATVAGVDVSFTDELACAAIVLMSYPEVDLLATVIGRSQAIFPYIPGLLAFREGPAILAAWEKLNAKPDLLLFDGHGIAHPRGFGLASHLGLWLETPSVGVAKSRLYGRHADVGEQAGDQSLLWDENDPERVIGAVVRTREKSRPIYFSPGNLIDLENALAFGLACCTGHRLPEPLR
jgi:deoxyribonuclease V